MLKPYEGPARVLVGFDGSDDSSRALAYAIDEAKARNAELVLVHAVDDTVLNSAWGVVFDPEAIKAAAAEMLAGGVSEAANAGLPADRVRTDVVLGNPAAALTRLSENASLIVVGRRSMPGGERVFVGSTTVGVAGAAHCPVIMVSDTGRPHGQRSGLVGVAVDSAARGAIALEWALQEGRRRGGSVVVLSVCRAPQGRFFHTGHPTQEQQDAAVAVTRDRIREMVAPYASQFPDVPMDIQVSYGSPLDILVAKTDELDLLVLEVHASFPTYSVGGVVRGLMTHGRCPIGTIRAKDSHGS